jgi:hypothetical protein
MSPYRLALPSEKLWFLAFCPGSQIFSSYCYTWALLGSPNFLYLVLKDHENGEEKKFISFLAFIVNIFGEPPNLVSDLGPLIFFKKIFS